MKLFFLLLIAFAFRLFNLGMPEAYIFDEVYHVPSLRAISQNNPNAYDPYAKAPEPNTAYDWLHPPLAKLFQAGSVKLLGDNSFAWRFPSVIFGTISIAALYFFTLTVFNNQSLALLAAAIFSFDNLQLTMSRIAMNDIFVTTWIILALTFFYRKNLLITGLFTGLALATKHSAILLYPIFLIFFIPKLIKNLKLFLPAIFCFLIIPALIYFLSYSQLFLQGGSLTDFYNLHKQIYWYQTHLTATHSYQSTAWQWPLLIRPVWFYVNYLKDSIANIYNLGNPAIFWGGLIALAQGPFLKRSFKAGPYWYLLISYFALFSPFIFSPRIMFLHHYLPALPFLCLILAKAIFPSKKLSAIYLGVIIILFLFFYPLNTAIPINKDFLKFWFWLPTWR
ncbi:MAG: glycosyltransferase family 39 protein [Patescibacteria group bacterium]|nr:glycosyltransferase family 39 protein [Patescibacteria group bacterium]